MDVFLLSHCHISEQLCALCIRFLVNLISMEANIFAWVLSHRKDTHIRHKPNVSTSEHCVALFLSAVFGHFQRKYQCGWQYISYRVSGRQKYVHVEWCPISNPFFIDCKKECLQGNINSYCLLWGLIHCGLIQLDNRSHVSTFCLPDVPEITACGEISLVLCPAHTHLPAWNGLLNKVRFLGLISQKW